MTPNRTIRWRDVPRWGAGLLLAGSALAAATASADPPAQSPAAPGFFRMLRGPSAPAVELPAATAARAATAVEYTRTVRMARQLYEQGRLYEAWSTVRAARQLDPRPLETYLLEARIARDLRDNATARWALQSGWQAAPRTADECNTLGQRLAAAGAKDDALAALRQAVEQAPDDLQYARDLSAAALALGEPETAVEALERARRWAPDDLSLPVALARLHESLGHWSEAVRYYGMALDNEPDQPLWRRSRARCAFRRFDYEQVRDDYQACAAVVQLTLAERAQFAEACLKLDDFAQAAALFDSIAAWGIHNREIERMRGLCHLQTDDVPTAHDILRQAVKDWPDDERLERLMTLCRNRLPKAATAKVDSSQRGTARVSTTMPPTARRPSQSTTR